MKKLTEGQIVWFNLLFGIIMALFWGLFVEWGLFWVVLFAWFSVKLVPLSVRVIYRYLMTRSRKG